MKKNIKIYQNKILAERFRILMGKHQITLKDIADKTGCAISTVSTWRRGRPPRNKNIIKKINYTEHYLYKIYHLIQLKKI